MAVVARLFEDIPGRRAGDRRAVTLGATVRDRESRPYDGTVHDLSPTGFLIRTSARLPVGGVTRIGLSGIGTRAARVMWQQGALRGCAFVTPISAADMETALHADTVTRVAFASPPVDRDAAIPAGRDARIAMLTMFGLSVLLWVVAAAGVAAFA